MTKQIFLMVLAIVTAFGDKSVAQLTDEQQKLYYNYIKENITDTAVSRSDDIDRYTTPEFYPEADADLMGTGNVSDTQAVSAAAQIEKNQYSGIKAFGYDLFDGSPENFSPIMEATPPPDYKLGPGDHVLVNIWGHVDMQLELTVDREGKVFIPKVGEIIVWGLTMDEFKQRLDQGLSSAYSDYELSISLGKIRRIKIFVYGEVKKPGGYTLSSLATLFNALHVAGGATVNGSLRTIKHIRHTKILSEIDLYRFLLTGDNSQDAELQSGDVIFVPVVGPRVSVTGEVKRPAVYEITGGERLRDLIGLGGGSTAQAFLEMVDIDRIGSDDNRILLTLDISSDKSESENNLELADGDRVNVSSIYDSLKNTVVLSGHIKHPGRYELTEGMRVSDLLGCGELLIKESYLERANLFRTKHDMTREVYAVNLQSVLQGDDSTDYLLADNDSLVVYSHKEIKREMTVSIAGAVKRPGNFEYFCGMRLSDLIFLAGNPLKQAYLLRAEIARVNPGKPADMIYVNLAEALDGGVGSEDIPLEEDDIVYIRSIPGWRIGESVMISGEVIFPGSYTLIKENERLSDLLERCGGATPEAFIKGLVFLRNSISADIERKQVRNILASTEATVLDSLNRPIPKINPNVDLGQVNRIVIDIERLRKDLDSPDNVVLRNGDYIYVPEIPSGVQVTGAVASSGTIAFKKGKKPGYFVQKAGGYVGNASKGELRLIKADGRIYSGRKASREKVEIGDIVVVPFKMQKERAWLSTASSVAGVLASVFTTIFVIDRLN